jgi:hypothetical protein
VAQTDEKQQSDQQDSDSIIHDIQEQSENQKLEKELGIQKVPRNNMNEIQKNAQNALESIEITPPGEEPKKEVAT